MPRARGAVTLRELDRRATPATSLPAPPCCEPHSRGSLPPHPPCPHVISRCRARAPRLRAQAKFVPAEPPLLALVPAWRPASGVPPLRVVAAGCGPSATCSAWRSTSPAASSRTPSAWEMPTTTRSGSGGWLTLGLRGRGVA